LVNRQLFTARETFCIGSSSYEINTSRVYDSIVDLGGGAQQSTRLDMNRTRPTVVDNTVSRAWQMHGRSSNI